MADFLDKVWNILFCWTRKLSFLSVSKFYSNKIIRSIVFSFMAYYPLCSISILPYEHIIELILCVYFFYIIYVIMYTIFLIKEYSLDRTWIK